MSRFWIITGLLMGAAVIFGFYERSRCEEKLKAGPLKPGRKTALMTPLMLPLMLAVVSFMGMLTGGGLLSGMIIARAGVLFLCITIYYAALLLLLPLLRRTISARACGNLWLVPTLLYFSLYLNDYEATPLLLITLPRQRLAVFARIWLAGFAVVVLWQLVSHFRYRGFLLNSAQKVTDDRILSLWHTESARHGVKAEIPVFVSDSVSTPLSIGCFDRTMRLILPRQRYTEEELFLIFRHELRHILREDTQTKLFIGLCTAVCWFNPLAWIARKRASEDLELSCDEAVLSGADGETRRRYAELLLKTAGSSPGYTTCLSASASSLRYRLRNIVKPVKRFSGGVVIGLASFGLMMAVSAVAFADSVSTAQSVIFDKAPSGLTVDSISIYRKEQYGFKRVHKWEEEALTEYLASLRVKQVYAGSYTKQVTRQLYVDYGELADGEVASWTRVRICDGLLFANIPYDGVGEITFLLEDELDWDYINSLLDFKAGDQAPEPVPPEMMMDFGEAVSPDGELIYASNTVLSVKRADVKKRPHEITGDKGDGGVSGYPVTQVKLHFSYAPQGEYKVIVENWERTVAYTVSSGELEDDLLPLAPYSAYYTVYGTFTTYQDTTYEMKFAFHVNLP